MEKEIWKSIDGYESIYEVSNKGKIKSLKREIRRKCRNKPLSEKVLINEKILTPKNNAYGYHIIRLCKYGSYRNFFIHRLVAQAFIENTNKFPIINHKNENKKDNRVENLEWCTIKYNTNYGDCLIKRAKTQGKPVNKYDLEGNFIENYYSIGEAARQNNTYPSGIYNCCNNKRVSIVGYTWRHA